MNKKFRALLIIISLTLVENVFSQTSTPEKYFNLGLQAYKSEDYQKALNYITKAAEQGLSDAEYFLGFMYGMGTGVEVNLSKALYYLNSAANKQNEHACYLLGVLYYTGGDGVSQDYNKAREYFEKANYLPVAQTFLGDIYYLGKGVLKDEEKGIYWFKKASAQGNGYASIQLSFIYTSKKYESKKIENHEDAEKYGKLSDFYLEEALKQNYSLEDFFNEIRE